MYKVIICDDNTTILKLLGMLLGKYTKLYDFEIISFSTGEALLEYCRANPFDIVYLDIRLEEHLEASNGMDYAKVLKIINPRSLTIYITAYDTYYRSVVNAEPFRFIEKDMQDMDKFEHRLLGALDDAIERLEGGKKWTYTYNRQQYSVGLTQIAAVYSFARKVHIISLQEIEQDFYYGKLSEIQRALENDSKEFVQINKKTIVNVLYVQRMKNKVRVGGKTFTIAPEYREMFEYRFLRYGRDVSGTFV